MDIQHSSNATHSNDEFRVPISVGNGFRVHVPGDPEVFPVFLGDSYTQGGSLARKSWCKEARNADLLGTMGLMMPTSVLMYILREMSLPKTWRPHQPYRTKILTPSFHRASPTVLLNGPPPYSYRREYYRDIGV